MTETGKSKAATTEAAAGEDRPAVTVTITQIQLAEFTVLCLTEEIKHKNPFSLSLPSRRFVTMKQAAAAHNQHILQKKKKQ